MLRDFLGALEAHARGMWRFRWRAVLVTWLICAVGWFSVYTMPDVYEATARVYVDTENTIRPLLQGIASTSDVMSEVTAVTREMLSRPNLAEVARNTDLDLRATTDREYERLLDSLQERIEVLGSRDNIFSIAFRDPDRSKAVAVVDSLVDTFVEKSLGAGRTETSKAQSFLQEQIAEYEQRLTDAEDRLAEFKRLNVAFMPDQKGDYFSRLQAARTALTATQGRLQLAEERRAELLRQIEGEEPVFGIMPVSPVESGSGGFADAKIRELEAQLEELRLRYTDKHPRIGQILDTIELLKKQQQEEAAQSAAEGGSGSVQQSAALEQNPVYQNMRIQLTNTEVEIASLRAELRQQREEVTELQTLVDTVPQVEAELNRLNRDYGVVKAKYEQLLQQLETANIGEDVEASIDDIQFRVIDPPFASLQPAGPERELFMAVILLAALGVGGGISFVFNQLQPVFFGGGAVTAATGIPVLGSVSLLLSAKERRAKRLGRLQFILVMAMLFTLFALLSAFAGQWSPIVRNITRMVA